MKVLRTLRGRLVLATGGAIVAAVVMFAVASMLLVSHQLRSSLDTALRQRAEAVAELAVAAPAVLNAPGALESPVSGRQIVVEVLDARGRILARSLTLGVRLLPVDQLVTQALRTGVAGYENVGLGGHSFRLYAAPIAQAGGPAAGGAVLVASDTTDIADTIGHLELLVALAGAAAAALAVVAVALLTRRVLRPLGRLAAGAAEIERTADPTRRLPERTAEIDRTADPTRRLPERAAADEIAQLTGVLNRMLSSLEQARMSERRFLADASHELRTPVAALLGNIEYAAAHGADPEVLADLQHDAARLAHLVDSLLTLERAAGALPQPQEVSLADLAQEVVREHEVAGHRVSLVTAAPVSVRGDAAALRRLLENLIDNALVHGPAGGRVTVAVARDAGAALLSVSDDGPGPPRDQLDHVFERFWRGPGTSGRPGSGLGLAIVAAIAERHDGTVAVTGSKFEVRLPARSVSAPPLAPAAGPQAN